MSDHREEFRATRFYGSQAAAFAATFVVVSIAGGSGGAAWVAVPFLGTVLGNLWRARRSVVVIENAGARLPHFGVVPWDQVGGLEVIEGQPMRWIRWRPRTRLRLRFVSLPDGWVRIRGSTPGVEVPVVDDEDKLRQSIERRLQRDT